MFTSDAKTPLVALNSLEQCHKGSREIPAMLACDAKSRHGSQRARRSKNFNLARNFQSRILDRIFDLARKLQSRRLDSPQKIGPRWVARSKISFLLEIFNLARTLNFFLIFGPSGLSRSSDATDSGCGLACDASGRDAKSPAMWVEQCEPLRHFAI